MITALSCTRCPHEWPQRGTEPPVKCPKCGSPYWNRERTRETARDASTDSVARVQVPIPASPQKAVIADLRDLIAKVEDGRPAPVRQAVAEHLGRSFSPSPYEESEQRRRWAEELARLKKLGMYDEAGAAEGFTELLGGRQLPAGFQRWSEAKKLDYLVENVTLEDK